MNAIDPRLSRGAVMALTGCLALVSWHAGYAPASRRDARDGLRVSRLSQQITQTEQMVQADGGTATWLAHHQERFAHLQARLPRQEQVPQLLNTLVETFKATELHVLNVSQGNLEPVPNASTSSALERQTCARLPVTVTAEGRYPVLLAVLEHLTRDTFPAVVTIEGAECRLKEAGGALLAITVQLDLYVVGGPSAPSNPS